MSDQLRPYQEEALSALKEALRSGRGHYLLHLGEGGGKTWVAVDLVAGEVQDGGATVLWVAKDWTLLRQAYECLSTRHPDVAPSAGRMGGGYSSISPCVSEGQADVIFTTLHTFDWRLSSGRLPVWLAPRLLIWDECHWGQCAKIGRGILAWAERQNCSVVGLTATPLATTVSSFRTVFSRSFVELVNAGYLARPRVGGDVQTGMDWHPSVSTQTGDFHRSSLAALAKNDARNRLIVGHYQSRACDFGQTLVFACDINHAIALANMFSAEGVPARPIHSRQPPQANTKFLEEFSRGAIQILVTVEKLTHGVDMPFVKTIFLCRPTLSDILYSQMVGRGSRLHVLTGKTCFTIVDFVDNVSRFSDQLCAAKNQFKGVRRSEQRSVAQRRRPVEGQHSYNPDGAPTWIPVAPDVPEEIRGLFFRQDQTFGIEFELTRAALPVAHSEAWMGVVEALRSSLAAALGVNRVAPTPIPTNQSRAQRMWCVVWDGSCGWEIRSPVLWNQEGFEEVVTACEALSTVVRAENLRVNYRTGPHVHLGWGPERVGHLINALLLVRAFEPALGTLVAPSRLVHFDGRRYMLESPNSYCKPVSAMFPASKLMAAQADNDVRALVNSCSDRYLSFNVCPLLTLGTVEVRLHSGTTEAHKILLWVSLWQQILWAAGGDQTIEPAPDRRIIVPSGDILELARRYLPMVQPPGFIHRLEQRRNEIAGRWLQYPELLPWAQLAGSWLPVARTL